MSTRRENSIANAANLASSISDNENLSDEARRIARSLSRLISADAGWETAEQLHRRELVEESTVTLDGQPARVSGYLADPAAISAIAANGARQHIFRSWDDVEHVIKNLDGRFSS